MVERTRSRYHTLLVAMFASLALAGCSAPVRKTVETVDAPAAVVNDADVSTQTKPKRKSRPVRKPDAVYPAAATPEVPALAFWPRVTQSYSFIDCDDPSRSQSRWQRIYLQSPERHAANIAQVAPLMGYVADELERRQLPLEFIWLPYVESGYHPFRTSGDRPAGAWQLMPATARWRGLKIKGDYDGRLDFVAATDAALDLLEHLAQVFNRDWPLVTMAYNAGEYRIKGALERARKSRKPARPEDLAVSTITHEHLIKLRALACIAARAEALGWSLPAFDESAQLVAMRVERAMPARQVATLSGVGYAQWSLWNPAWRSGQVAAGADVLVPRRSLDATTLALASAKPEPVAAIVEPAGGTAAVHVIRSGESAWTIARSYRVSLEALLAANGLTVRSILRPGQKLRLP